MMLDNRETWKAIRGYEGYFVSDLGNVKRVDSDGVSHILHQIIQRQGKFKPVAKVRLYGGEYVDECLVHRLVAKYFCKGEGTYVLHKDGNSLNNNASNLYYTSSMLGHSNLKKSPVDQFSLDGDFIRRYESMSDAERATGIKQAGISQNCRGISKSSGGYIWKLVKK